MKLVDVISMFSLFGFSEDIVRRALAAGDSAHNAMAALQTSLQLRWADMNQEWSLDELRTLKPTYETLMGLKMTARTTPAQKAKVRRVRQATSFDHMMDGAEARKREKAKRFHGVVGEHLRKMKEDGTLSEKRAREIGFGYLFDDDD